ncbi:MAG: UDP-N-acetylmuramate--L-alanine ligase [Kiritimatiellae bacterium]|nr:UDP-N-acetylmuramate--L-alanine ligase [Kiritimatiellia bacterium]
MKYSAEQLKPLRFWLRKEQSHVHLMGIAGIGMAGLAKLLADKRFLVTGCDLSDNQMKVWLQDQGIQVFNHHSPTHLDSDVDWVVYSTAIIEDQEELRAAKQKGIPAFHRGVVLATFLEDNPSVAICGSHGKTTTTAMMTHVFQTSGLDVGYCIGGSWKDGIGVADSGTDNLMIVEADESDSTLGFYQPETAVITNIEFDHMKHFKDEESFIDCFRGFVDQVRKKIFYCADDPEGDTLCKGRENACSYGLSHQADISGRILEERSDGTLFSVNQHEKALGVIRLSVPGRYNVVNALAALGVGLEYGCSLENIKRGLESFIPVRRRFEIVCETQGVLVISDYAHHPTEIRNVIQTAKRLERSRIFVVFQPHRYTRTRTLKKDFPAAFEGVDKVILLPVYAASEEPVLGGTVEDLYQQFLKNKRFFTHCENSLEKAWERVKREFQDGDLVLIIGAGDVGKMANWAIESCSK